MSKDYLVIFRDRITLDSTDKEQQLREYMHKCGGTQHWINRFVRNVHLVEDCIPEAEIIKEEKKEEIVKK